MKPPSEEEEYAADLLRLLFPGVVVEPNDNGTQNAMFDVRVGEPMVAAAEVGQLTDPEARKAEAHWRKALEGEDDPRLTHFWLFSFGADRTPEGHLSYPHVPLRDSNALVRILVALEEKGITRIERPGDALRFVPPDGLRWIDPDVEALFNLIGDCTPIIATPTVNAAAGWRFALVTGGASTLRLDDIVEHAVATVWSLSDLRSKLEASGASERIAVMMYDHRTDMGWATSHWPAGELPEVAPTLPPEVDSLLIAGMNDLAIYWGPHGGWRHVQRR